MKAEELAKQWGDKYIATYDEYKALLGQLKETGKLMSFKKALHSDSFIVLRHDVEYSLDKAARMAVIEYEAGVKSTYFVQIESPAYNALSPDNYQRIQIILRTGHKVGLHYRQQLTLNRRKNEYAIAKQMEVLGNAIGQQVSLFSVHIPDGGTDYQNYKIPGAVNAYAQPFFRRFGEPGDDVLYISDSELHWNYALPTAEVFEANKRIQLLVHPYGWDDRQRTPAEIFTEMAEEKAKDLIACFRTDYRPYGAMEGKA